MMPHVETTDLYGSNYVQIFKTYHLVKKEHKLRSIRHYRIYVLNMY